MMIFITILLGALIAAGVFVVTYLAPKVKRQSSRFQKSINLDSSSPLSPIAPESPSILINDRKKVKIIMSPQSMEDQNNLLIARKSKSMSKSNFTLDMSHKAMAMLSSELKTGFEQYNHLNLSHNQLSVLPAWFFTTWGDRLTTLDLANNSFFELPAQMDKLHNLKHLDVSYNRLGDFPSVLLKCTKLESLNIAGNGLVFLSPNISKLEELEELNVSFNSLSMLPEINLKKLKRFEVHNNKFVGPIHQVLKDLQQRNPEIEITQIDEKRKSIVKNTIKNRVKTKQDRIHALKEILKSEEVYNKYLELLFNEYFLPLTANGNGVLRFEELNLPLDTRRAMFPPGLQSIVNFNAELLKELKQRIHAENPSEMALVGDVFKSRAAFFKVYTSYISGYHTAQKYLSEFLSENEQFALKIQEGRSLTNSNGVDLPSLLIMPIQRIPRYVLLLKAILDNTDSMHPDHKNLTDAVQAMSETATFVNTKIKEAANLRKVMDIQEELNFNDLVQPYRTFVKEGKLTMKRKEQSASSQVKIYLFNDMVILTEFKLLYALFGDFVRRFPLEEIQIAPCENDLCFQIVCDARSKKYELEAHSSQEKEEWVQLLQKYKQECSE